MSFELARSGRMSRSHYDYVATGQTHADPESRAGNNCLTLLLSEPATVLTGSESTQAPVSGR